MKTRKEIIDETVAAYTLNTRAIEGGLCKYLTGEGTMCAVGRCCLEPKVSWDSDCMHILDLGGEPVNLESELKPEYRGHDIRFWKDIQLFHDKCFNWTDSGLSDDGVFKRRYLHRKWDEA